MLGDGFQPEKKMCQIGKKHFSKDLVGIKHTCIKPPPRYYTHRFFFRHFQNFYEFLTVLKLFQGSYQFVPSPTQRWLKTPEMHECSDLKHAGIFHCLDSPGFSEVHFSFFSRRKT